MRTVHIVQQYTNALNPHPIPQTRIVYVRTQTHTCGTTIAAPSQPCGLISKDRCAFKVVASQWCAISHGARASLKAAATRDVERGLAWSAPLRRRRKVGMITRTSVELDARETDLDRFYGADIARDGGASEFRRTCNTLHILPMQPAAVSSNRES